MIRDGLVHTARIAICQPNANGLLLLKDLATDDKVTIRALEGAEPEQTLLRDCLPTQLKVILELETRTLPKPARLRQRHQVRVQHRLLQPQMLRLQADQWGHKTHNREREELGRIPPQVIRNRQIGHDMMSSVQFAH